MKAVITHRTLKIHTKEESGHFDDHIIAEEPLEIYVQEKGKSQKAEPFMLTMRTPGEDLELALGVLFSSGIILDKSDLISHKYLKADKNLTQIVIHLNAHTQIKNKKLYTHSSCGICNAESLEEVLFHSTFPVQDKNLKILSKVILKTFQCFKNSKDHFSMTGGNHKVCLLSQNGESIIASEDVGRHNAMDKVIGRAILNQMLPLKNSIVALSGRCSFEMTQKAWMAGIPVIACLGAPTSKAVDLANNAGITLIGFVKESSFNIYTHPGRIVNE